MTLLELKILKVLNQQNKEKSFDWIHRKLSKENPIEINTAIWSLLYSGKLIFGKELFTVIGQDY